MALLLRLNDYLLMEYSYEEYTHPDSEFAVVNNGHDGTITIINDADSINDTANVDDLTSVALPTGKFALLDRESEFYYPNYDPQISIVDETIPGSSLAVYNRVKIHMLSGYNFNEGDIGFLIRFYIRTATGDQQFLSSYTFLRGDTRGIKYSTIPIKISELVFDKYVQFDILSKSWLDTIPAGNTYSVLIPNGIDDMNNIYCEYRSITNVDTTDGVAILSPSAGERLAISSIDKFSLIGSIISNSQYGDYIEILPAYNGESIENFIYALNGKAGNDYYLIHDIELKEQIGTGWHTTHNQSSIQTNNYDTAIRYRPIVINANATSFSVVHTMRLYNRVNGSSIFTVTSYTSSDVTRYGRYLSRLNLDVSNPVKIYNSPPQIGSINVNDNSVFIPNIKIVQRFVVTNDVLITVDGEVKESIELEIKPFDSLFKFGVIKTNGDDLKAVDLSGTTGYKMVFTNNAGSQISIPELVSQQYSKSNGELMFKIPKATAAVLPTYQDNTFYVVTDGAEETVLFTGTFDNYLYLGKRQVGEQVRKTVTNRFINR